MPSYLNSNLDVYKVLGSSLYSFTTITIILFSSCIHTCCWRILCWSDSYSVIDDLFFLLWAFGIFLCRLMMSLALEFFLLFLFGTLWALYPEVFYLSVILVNSLLITSLNILLSLSLVSVLRFADSYVCDVSSLSRPLQGGFSLYVDLAGYPSALYILLLLPSPVFVTYTANTLIANINYFFELWVLLYVVDNLLSVFTILF